MAHSIVYRFFGEASAIEIKEIDYFLEHLKKMISMEYPWDFRVEILIYYH